MAKSGYQRLKQWRERVSTGEQLPKCKICDRPIKGKLSVERGVCSYCFPKTDEGSKANIEAVKRHRRKED
ncbi:hypothetical protein [aff. Roholtiella sp. LEGE 12411]|uniref:hypothetical protein n=1 Tax=aff. Roholtiella sp. LEGE 12411 TaxID=1828822 RepID=UPI001881941E|nr:hypothetical protein [aff. Roholtiella sp. LEGE 12411]MBE9038112.1 hypothetical protein [aff. Roholtiella sp. LEGE 12411]